MLGNLRFCDVKRPVSETENVVSNAHYSKFGFEKSLKSELLFAKWKVKLLSIYPLNLKLIVAT